MLFDLDLKGNFNSFFVEQISVHVFLLRPLRGGGTLYSVVLLFFSSCKTKMIGMERVIYCK